MAEAWNTTGTSVPWDEGSLNSWGVADSVTSWKPQGHAHTPRPSIYTENLRY